MMSPYAYSAGVRFGVAGTTAWNLCGSAMIPEEPR